MNYLFLKSMMHKDPRLENEAESYFVIYQRNSP
jgi:hypothetical protein